MRRCRGITLIDTLMAMSLLGLFAAVAGAFTVEVTRLQRDAGRVTAHSAQVETVLRRLRADVWASASVTVEHQGVLRLESSAWSWDAQASVLRRAVQGHTEIIPCATPLAWSVMPGGLHVAIGGAEIPMASQQMVFGEKRP